MATIREVNISNFRGIHSLRWWPNPGLNCLIGSGDSGKSTILDAIELTIGASQNVAFSDSDFHNCNIDEPIVLDITLGNLDDYLLNLESYGHFFRGWDRSTGELHNETSAELETVLTARLIVRHDLEPQWILYSEGASAEGREKNLQWKHRQKISPTRLGAIANHHMTLSPRSVLSKLSADRTQASAALAAAARQARETFANEGCGGVDEIIATSTRIAQEMGIPTTNVLALLDAKGVSFTGGAISLHDEEQIPLKSLGSGSMRLLVAGLQKAAGQSSLFIIDELEYGLEPYRIVRLLDTLGAKQNHSSQQVFMTTHSPVVLRELSSAQLFSVRMSRTIIPAVVQDGVEQSPVRKIISNAIFPLGGSEEAQKTIRACADAFLAPKVIICEGKTEIGVLRGLDLYNQDQDKLSILAKGCHWADGNGASMIERSKLFSRMGYKTALFMDSDVPFSPELYAELNNEGISVFRWQDGLSIEAALFSSAPNEIIPAILQIACEWKSEDSINAKIQQVSGGAYSLTMCRENFIIEMRPVLAQCAGEGKWFKDIEPAERLIREVVAPHWPNMAQIFSRPLNELWQWMDSD